MYVPLGCQLSPADSAIVEQHKKQLMEAKQYARSKSIVSLADKTEDKEKDNIDNKIDLVSCVGDVDLEAL